MQFSKADWEVKRNSGLVRFLLIDGILKAGGPFAVVMQVIGLFLFREESQSIGQYFTSTRTWITFLLHGTLFGLIVGFVNWRRHEKAFAAVAENGDKS